MKRPRPEYNADELDDVDDWKPEDDEEEEGAAGAVSEHALQEAKRMRRLRRAGQEYEGDLDDDEEDEGRRGDTQDHGEPKRNGWDTKGESASLFEDDEHDDNGGVAITPFSMEEEENDGGGYFDGDTYVFRNKRGDDEEPDAWADALDEESNDAGRARYTVEGTVATSTRDADTTNAPGAGDWTEEDLYARILPLVSDSETITAAIVRYGNLIKREATRGVIPSNGNRDPTAKVVDGATSLRAQEALNELTEASSALLLKGQVDIYQKTRADLLLLLPDSSETAKRMQAGNNSLHEPSRKQVVQWEYMGNEDKQIHGPFTSEQMLQWVSAGWFVGASAVQIRPIFEKPAESSLQDDLMSDLMDDDGDEDGQTAKVRSETEIFRGEWQQSDQVDFSQYL
jgi:CD2 antigen cytoplasmic tail-binding protein 2